MSPPTAESLFLALARVLKEDWKKSIELSTNIVYIFFCFSTFSVFHRLLAQHKIGSTCMTVLEHEIKRYKSLQDDLTQKRKNCIFTITIWWQVRYKNPILATH